MLIAEAIYWVAVVNVMLLVAVLLFWCLYHGD